jgi:aryl-alcohol dehydrogenase-like predicted oxidoreductase
MQLARALILVATTSATGGPFARRARPLVIGRRLAIQASLPAWIPWSAGASSSGGAPQPQPSSSPRATNEVLGTNGGMQLVRLGGSDVAVSRMGMGTQRWGSADFNAPDEALCHRLLDVATSSGVNLVDTAEQYPIPSDARSGRGEGSTEAIIGRWIAKSKSHRAKLVIASKITGGARISRENILADFDGTLRRLQTDYLDSYLLHWPARYTPQANWGQSLAYDASKERQPYYRSFCSFDEIAATMGELVAAGKLRSYGMCNDNAVGLCMTAGSARALGVAPPAVMQGDFSIINRRSDENGLAEASSPLHANAGFLAYNVLAGGVLTGKYLAEPAAVDVRGSPYSRAPRGRMDDESWGRTLYRYRSGPADAATREYARLAARYGLSLTELALRWCRHRPFVTSSLVGVTSVAQFEENLRALEKGPLSGELQWEIDRVHMRNRLPIFSSDRVGKDWDGEGEIGETIP